MEESQKLSSFKESGLYLFDDSNVVFVDPVRVLSRCYTRFRVSPSAYYRRFFDSPRNGPLSAVTASPGGERSTRKRKRNKKEPPPLNEREQVANRRHLEARPLLFKAHESLLKCTELLDALRTLNDSGCSMTECESTQPSFIELGREMPQLQVTLNLSSLEPQQLESDFEDDFTVDPPWENASARQKARYPTLPNRYFLSLPIKQLTHSDGALVALWVTNREKLRSFVEKELFPAWGVSYATTFYWLKVKSDGSLITDLDLFHHRPYESLILGYSPGKSNDKDDKSNFKAVKEDHVIMSIPGDYSRKPPIADLLLDHVPGHKPPRCIELFAREMMAGSVAWGNEPLHFQDSRYFVTV